MDYERKYKEALGWMKSLYGGLHGKTKEEAEKYFPELAESEDEKIRKALIKFLKDCIIIDSGYFPKYCEISSEQMIAWLEKQGEQKPGWSEDDNSFCKENCKGYQETGRCFADGDCKAKREAEQKPTLSEEDDMIEETLYFLREYQQSNRCKDENGMQNSVSCEKWLKSLKERLS